VLHAGCVGAAGLTMKELFRSNNIVRLSWAQAQLRDAGIDSLVLDHHTSLVEGSIGAIPRRLVVAERDYRRARAIIAAAEAELG
jgi:Putative prokaryotic signal transducing protein